jgi:hypothetical protein
MTDSRRLSLSLMERMWQVYFLFFLLEERVIPFWHMRIGETLGIDRPTLEKYCLLIAHDWVAPSVLHVSTILVKPALGGPPPWLAWFLRRRLNIEGNMDKVHYSVTIRFTRKPVYAIF